MNLRLAESAETNQPRNAARTIEDAVAQEGPTRPVTRQNAHNRIEVLPPEAEPKTTHRPQFPDNGFLRLVGDELVNQTRVLEHHLRSN
jgi:hypothetical protein